MRFDFFCDFIFTCQMTSLSPPSLYMVKYSYYNRYYKIDKQYSEVRLIMRKLFAILLSLILFGYGVLTFVFHQRYPFLTQVNGVDVSFKTPEEVHDYLKNHINNQPLTLIEKENAQETIDPKVLQIKFGDSKKLQKELEETNAFLWPKYLLPNYRLSFETDFRYDEKAMDQLVKGLKAVSGSQVVKMVNAKPVYEKGQFVIKKEVVGNQIDQKILKKAIINAILRNHKELNLEEENCYILPEYTSEHQSVIAARDKLNHSLKTKLTYQVGSSQTVLEPETIAKWLEVDKNMKVHIKEELLRDYVDGLSETYNTYGMTRPFTTSGGSVIYVYGGDYGWIVDTEEEVKTLKDNVTKGEKLEREPVFAQRAAGYGNRDYGDTYVEISIGAQHMWMYQNGALVVSTPIVTGKISQGYYTPSGTYALAYKAYDVVLRGEGYASPVTFWMPFNGDIGIHDASWREKFGGDIYINDGSHGCVNTPYPAAATIFNHIEAGDPVIVY